MRRALQVPQRRASDPALGSHHVCFSTAYGSKLYFFKKSDEIGVDVAHQPTGRLELCFELPRSPPGVSDDEPRARALQARFVDLHHLLKRDTARRATDALAQVLESRS